MWSIGYTLPLNKNLWHRVSITRRQQRAHVPPPILRNKTTFLWIRTTGTPSTTSSMPRRRRGPSMKTPRNFSYRCTMSQIWLTREMLSVLVIAGKMKGSSTELPALNGRGCVHEKPARTVRSWRYSGSCLGTICIAHQPVSIRLNNYTSVMGAYPYCYILRRQALDPRQYT